MNGSKHPVAVVAFAVATLLTGCLALSDGAYDQHRSSEERKRRLAMMKDSTADWPRGAAVEGDDLRALVAGTTHVFVYRSSPLGRKGRFVAYHYFAPDGSYVYDDTERMQHVGTWRVDGARLCIVTRYSGSVEHCYTIAQTPDRRVQYYIDDPGDYYGLLTKVTHEIRSGPAAPPETKP